VPVSDAVRIRKTADRGADLSPIIAEIRASGVTSLSGIAKARFFFGIYQRETPPGMVYRTGLRLREAGA
jgi:hypothetical protein